MAEERGRVRRIEWDGVTSREAFGAGAVAIRDAISNAARDYDWPGLLAQLERRPDAVNASRLGGTAWYAPLHQAAHGGAPVDVVERLLALGAWRTLRTATGERAVDLARTRGHLDLVELLEPRGVRPVDARALDRVQSHFHAVIRARIAGIAKAETLRLPELGPMTEYESASCWFQVPGMYGGFSFWISDDQTPTLIAESSCRIVEGSAQRHEVTPDGARQVAEGSA